MLTRLVQKHFFFTKREFELTSDEVRVRIKTLSSEEELTVMLRVLNPEPVIRKASLDFTSRVNRETLLSLYLGKPNTQDFNDFVYAVKESATNAYNAFAGLKSSGRAERLAGNVYDDPLDSTDSDSNPMSSPKRMVDAAKVDASIRMLSNYLDKDDIIPLISALEALKQEPGSDARLDRVVSTFSALGVMQGAALTYAPYLSVLLSDESV